MEQFPTEPQPESPEKEAEKEIENLLQTLRGLAERHDFDALTPELQEEWYWAEMETEAAKDREAAKGRLAEFVEKLKKELRE